MRVDFSDYLTATEYAEYRELARTTIAGWIMPPVDASTEGHEADAHAAAAIQLHRTTIEDLLIAVEALKAANRQIEAMVERTWPQWVQGMDRRTADRAAERVTLMRDIRHDLEEIVFTLYQDLDPGAPRPMGA